MHSKSNNAEPNPLESNPHNGIRPGNDKDELLKDSCRWHTLLPPPTDGREIILVGRVFYKGEDGLHSIFPFLCFAHYDAYHKAWLDDRNLAIAEDPCDELFWFAWSELPKSMTPHLLEKRLKS